MNIFHINHLKLIVLTLGLALLSSCSAPLLQDEWASGENAVTTISIDFLGPVNEKFPEQRQHNVQATYRTQHGTQEYFFPLTQSSVCAGNKSECKWAVVKTSLEYTIEPQPDQRIKISGILHSEMGRALSNKTILSDGYTQSSSITLPDEVPLIGESKFDKPFQRTLRIGEKLDLEGLVGVQIIVEFL